MKTLKQVINFPALLLHEVSHILVAYLLGGKLDSIKVKEHQKGHLVCLLNIVGLKENYVKFVAFSPSLIPIIFIFIGFTFPKIGVGYFMYSILTIKTTLPSPTDFKVCGFKVPEFIKI